MNGNKVSAFMLERYRLGELSPEEINIVDEALAADSGLHSRLKNLDESDRELRLLYPPESLGLSGIKSFGNTRKRVTNLARIAALVLVCILLPVLYLLRTGPESSTGIAQRDSLTDRAKGSVLQGAELSLYLEGNPDILSDQAVLTEGDTVQLAYTIPAGEHYGVIFSIDGRSEVTMHYPYRRGQSSILVSGRKTFLDEAYTLDDAPDYEVFVMVISGEPLDTDAVLREARRITRVSGLKFVEAESREAFEGCDVEIISVLKN
jgi:hypothetical protein